MILVLFMLLRVLLLRWWYDNAGVVMLLCNYHDVVVRKDIDLSVGDVVGSAVIVVVI